MFLYSITDHLSQVQALLDPLTDLVNKKKSFGPVHQLLVEGHLISLGTKLGVRESNLLMVTFRFLDRFVNGKPADAPAPETTKDSKDADDILQYVSGAIVHALNKRYTRKKQAERSESLVHFCIGKPMEESLITIKDRGRLTHPTEELTSFLCVGFRLCRGQPLNLKSFVTKMTRMEFYTTSPYKDVVKDIIMFFHKMMCHHQLKMFMEKYKVKKKCVGKGKALRTKLADKNSL